MNSCSTKVVAPPVEARVLQDGHRFVVVSGKFTNHLGVGVIKGPAGERLYTTKVERTLLDIAVRSIYCGGVGEVLEAYRPAPLREAAYGDAEEARPPLSIPPSHRLLPRAGWLRRRGSGSGPPGLEFDFYLTYGMDDTVYDKTWHLHPRGL